MRIRTFSVYVLLVSSGTAAMASAPPINRTHTNDRRVPDSGTDDTLAGRSHRRSCQRPVGAEFVAEQSLGQEPPG